MGSALTCIPAGQELRVFDLLTAGNRVAADGHLARSAQTGGLGDYARGDPVRMGGAVLGAKLRQLRRATTGDQARDRALSEALVGHRQVVVVKGLRSAKA